MVIIVSCIGFKKMEIEYVMVRPERFERPTAGTANQCSIQLSYERTPVL